MGSSNRTRLAVQGVKRRLLCDSVRLRSVACVALAWLTGCATTPPAIISYSLPETTLHVEATRALACNKSRTAIVAVDSFKVSEGNRASDNTDDQYWLSFEDLTAWHSGSDTAITFYDDGRRIKSLNSTVTGQGGEVTKTALAAISLFNAPAVMTVTEEQPEPPPNLDRLCFYYENARWPTGQELMRYQNPPEQSDEEKSGNGQVPSMLFTYRTRCTPRENRSSECTESEGEVLSPDPISAHHFSTIREPLCRGLRLSFPNDCPDSFFGNLVFEPSAGRTDAGEGRTDFPVHLADVSQVPSADERRLNDGGRPESEESEKEHRYSCVFARRPQTVSLRIPLQPFGIPVVAGTLGSGSVETGPPESFFADSVAVSQFGAPYCIPLSAPALFGETKAVLEFDESGELTKIQYSGTGGATAASTSLGSILDAITPESESASDRAAALKSEADEIYQRQRLLQCQADPENCPK